MNDRINDNDILDLIEGELPADRRAAVGEALRADPALRARVEGMIRDAHALAQDRDHPPAAPHALVARAIEQSAEPIAVVAPRSPRRFAMAAIITLAMLGVWGAILYMTFGPDINEGNPAEERPLRYAMIDEEQAQQLEQVMRPLEQTMDLPEFEGTETLGQRIADNTQNFDEVELDPEIEQMLNEFTELASAEKPLEELAPRLTQLLELDPEAPALAAVIEAAQENRLRVLVAGRDISDLSAFVTGVPGQVWLASATPLPVADHDFVRDYAKPAHGQETQAPVRSDASAPRVIRVRLALTEASDGASRDRDTARALNTLLSEWAAPAEVGAPESVRFIIEQAPITTESESPDDASPLDELPESVERFSVYFVQAEPASTSP